MNFSSIRGTTVWQLLKPIYSKMCKNEIKYSKRQFLIIFIFIITNIITCSINLANQIEACHLYTIRIRWSKNSMWIPCDHSTTKYWTIRIWLDKSHFITKSPTSSLKSKANKVSRISLTLTLSGWRPPGCLSMYWHRSVCWTEREREKRGTWGSDRRHRIETKSSELLQNTMRIKTHCTHILGKIDHF